MRSDAPRLDRPGWAPATEPDAARLFELSTGYVLARSLWAFVGLGLADRLAGEARTATRLAAETATHAGALERLLRLVAAAGVVSELEPGHFALTPAGELLRTDATGSMRSWVAMTGGPIFETFANLAHSLTTGEPAFETTFGADHYSYLRDHPDDARDFNDAMTAYSARFADASADSCDLGDVSTLVDIGAGPGTIAAALLRRNPRLRAVLFDLPHIAERAREHMERAGLAERCESVGGDFLTAVPAGGDAYLLGSILHNWDDEQALAILGNCRRAIAPGGRILLAEMTIGPGDGPSFAKLTDIVMLTAFGGRERTAREYSDLLAAAGFEPLGARPTRSHLSLIEGRAT